MLKVGSHRELLRREVPYFGPFILTSDVAVKRRGRTGNTATELWPRLNLTF